jgi:undecaprenyl-diphosphatase
VLGLPAIALAGLKELAELRHAGLDAHGWTVLALGLVVASLAAFVAIWASYASSSAPRPGPSPIYRAFIGAVLLAGVATGWLG